MEGEKLQTTQAAVEVKAGDVVKVKIKATGSGANGEGGRYLSVVVIGGGQDCEA